MKTLIIFGALAVLLISGVLAVQFGIKDDFNKKVDTINGKELCMKDSTKLVKDSKCEKDKPKYDIITNTTNSNLFYQNTEGVTRLKNG